MPGGVDPFRIELGTRSGRLDPLHAAGISGDYVWCFGSDQAGWTSIFSPGDEVSVSQTGDWAPADFISWTLRARGPVTMPTGWTWYFVARVGAVEMFRIELDENRERFMSELGIATTGLAATITLTFALLVDGPVTIPASTAELEIPAVYLDELILNVGTADFFVANRDPSESATDVPQNEVVWFDLVDITGSEPNPAATQIYIDGVLAYDGTSGGAQVGFSTTESAPTSGQYRFSVDYLPMPYESESTVIVRVVSANVAATQVLDETWLFTIEDATPPILVSAEAIELRRIEVLFNEPMLALTADASFWTLEPVQPDTVTPAIAVGVSGVVQLSSTEFALTLDDDPTVGIDYDVIVVGAQDAGGTAIIAPLNRVRFSSFVPPQPAGRRWDLWSMIPKYNRDEDESGTQDLRRFVNCLQEIEDIRLWELDQWYTVFDLDTAPEPYVDAMLVALGNPFAWTNELSATDKRRLGRILVDIYQQKGTAVGIENVVRFFLGIEVTVVPYSSFGWLIEVHELGWDTYLGTDVSRLLYSFDIETDVVLTTDERRRIAQIADYMKVAHEHHLRTIDATPAGVIDHLELGVSLLIDTEWVLH